MKNAKSPFLIPVCGLLSGLINGLLGAGGGVVTVKAMERLLAAQPHDTRDVFANALCVTLPTTAVSSLVYMQRGQLNAEGFAPFLLPALLGGVLGALLLGKLRQPFLQKLFASLVIISGVLMIAR